MDPALQTDLAILRLETSAEPTLSDVLLARRATLVPPGPAPDSTRIASNTVGINLNLVWHQVVTGAQLNGVPAAWVGPLSRRIRDCTVPQDPRCLMLVLDLAALELAEDEVDLARLPTPEASAVRPLWEILHSDPAKLAIAEEETAAWRAWAAENGEAAVRATLLGGRTADRELQLARGGDPLAALHLGGSTPWATALAAVLLLPGATEASETAQGAALRLGEEIWLLPRCGAFERAPETFVPGPGLEPRPLLARAAVEVAAAASRAGRRAEAHQAAALAVRLDPFARPAAPGIDSLLPPTMDATSNAGRQAGAMFSTQAPAKDGLEAGELRDPCR